MAINDLHLEQVGTGGWFVNEGEGGSPQLAQSTHFWMADIPDSVAPQLQISPKMATKSNAWHFTAENTLLVQIPIEVLQTTTDTPTKFTGPLFPAFLHTDGTTKYRVPGSLCNNIGPGIQDKILYKWYGDSSIYEAYWLPEAPKVHPKHINRI